jgi:hypothetical protein
MPAPSFTTERIPLSLSSSSHHRHRLRGEKNIDWVGFVASCCSDAEIYLLLTPPHLIAIPAASSTWILVILQPSFLSLGAVVLIDRFCCFSRGFVAFCGPHAEIYLLLSPPCHVAIPTASSVWIRCCSNRQILLLSLVLYFFFSLRVLPQRLLRHTATTARSATSTTPYPMLLCFFLPRFL